MIRLASLSEANAPRAFPALVWFRFLGAERGPNDSADLELITTRLLQRLHANVPREVGGVGARVRVQWGNPRSYYPASILEKKSGLYLIHYEDRSSTPDEWVGLGRIQSAGPHAFVQVGHFLLAPLVGCVGGRIAPAFRFGTWRSTLAERGPM